MTSAGAVRGGVRATLRVEGLAILVTSVVFYARLHGSWPVFAWLFFLPDVSFLAYLANRRFGALVYNSVHSYIGPLLLVAFSVVPFREEPFALTGAAIWAAHIGFDRALGYGLKYSDGFEHTHLGPFSRERS